MSVSATRLAAAVASSLAVVVLAGCTVSTNDEAVALDTDLFERVLTTTTSTTSTTVGQEVTKEVAVYFLQVTDGTTALRPVPREVPVDATAQEVLSNLFTVRPAGDERPAERGLSSAIPEGAELLSASVTPGATRLVVDVTGLFGDSGIQGNDLRNALAQIVYTAIDSSAEVTEVSFQNDGSPVPAIIGSGGTTDEPVTRADYSNLR